MGVNLLEIIKRFNYRGAPIHLVRRMAKQILIGLDYLHRICHLIHTDLKPENILICLSNEEIVRFYQYLTSEMIEIDVMLPQRNIIIRNPILHMQEFI